MDLNLAGLNALVTGASKGIGLAVARTLAQEGAQVTLVARDAGRLAAAAAQISEDTGVTPDIIAADLASREGVDLVAAHKGPLDILVNNAGAIPPGDLATIDEGTWRAAWDLKVFGYINLTRALAPRIAARGGVIVNVIGAGAETLSPDYICGAVGNAALVAFTRAYARQFAGMGGRIVGLNPGLVATERMQVFLRSRAAAELGDEGRAAGLTAGLPYGRAATPREVADAVAFLASPRSGYTNGTVVSVHGGA
ncbi:Short-chain dehydrogenase [Salipiger thiooxidans]|uniref:Short-chain dehydrogenase n=1 Tax=Salipiger thiooxidans TaxID=282683 RepID=A0A1G7LKA1_9RHOB|nr:short-chain dehydrogenase/reductase [Salipiger thiooxidans]SDF49379.1 Short-chain dehydrogenase [Salipiger thiooxidans]